MANQPKEKSLSVLYLELFRFIHNGEYERALKCCNRILNASFKESKAFHCKVVCMIHLTKFDEALSLITKNLELSGELYFEKAYCQYRLNQPEDALVTINNATKITNQLNELKAQVLYRLEKYQDCYTLYRDIIKNTSDDYEDERYTNLNAVMAYVSSSESKLDIKTNTYEMVYNTAYQHIMKGQYVEAERKLRVCEKMCREFLEEDGCADDEIEQELGIIKVQMAYCYHKQGRLKEAQHLYTLVLKAKSDDVGLTAVACNNVTVINKDQNLFDSKKKMKTATQEILNHKLNNYQRKTIATNNCLLSYYINQVENCRKQCEKLVEKWPETTATAIVIQALILQREGKLDEAVEVLNKLCEQHPEHKLYLQLTATHLLLLNDNKKRACEILHDLGDYTYRPAIVGALVTLHMALGDEQAAAKVFEDTVAWYRDHPGGQYDLSNMWLQASEFHMRHGHPSVAATSLEELLRKNPDDKRTIAKLIMAYVQCDKSKAEVLSKKLPSLDYLTAGLPEEDLENSTWIFGIRQPRNKAESSPGTPKNEVIKKKKSRKRKGKLPPGYDSEAVPDPERWLPKYERTGYRKKRERRGAKEIIKGSQGTSSGAADTYDFSGKALGEKDLEENLETVETSKTPGSAGKKTQRKKKKNGKW